MDTSPNLEQVMGVLRALIAVASGYAIGHGIGDADLWSAVSGVVIAVVPIVWSYAAHTAVNKARVAAKIDGVQVVVGSNAPASVRELTFDDSAPDVVAR